MYVITSPQAENGRRLRRIGELMGRVLAHGVDPSPPTEDDFDVSKMMKEKDLYVYYRGGFVKGLSDIPLAADPADAKTIDVQENHDNDDEAND